MAKNHSTLPDYQREFSARSVKNYIAGILGNAATSGFSAMLFSSWLTFVFVEYLGVGAAAIAAVVSVGVIVDGVSDFLMGIVLDRVISRWGKAPALVLHLRTSRGSDHRPYVDGAHQRLFCGQAGLGLRDV